MLIDCHIIQSYPASNLNRDDTGAAKTAWFGGAQRARISSQCLKRNIRQSDIFKEMAGDNLGVRTKFLPQLMKDEFSKLGLDEIAQTALLGELLSIKEDVTEDAKDGSTEDNGKKKAKAKKDLNKTSELLFISPEYYKALAKALAEEIDISDKKNISSNVKNITKRVQGEIHVAPDMALFGVMSTESNIITQQIDGAHYCAHLFSTHEIEQESDYFTALDDLETGKESAHLGDREFNASTYYGYQSICMDQLQKHLNDKEYAVSVATALIRELFFVTPTGMQHSFAAFTAPSLVLVEVKDKNTPLNYSDAFEEAIWSKRGFISPSVRSLFEHAEKLNKVYGKQRNIVKRFVINLSSVETTDQYESIDDFVEAIQKCLIELG